MAAAATALLGDGHVATLVRESPFKLTAGLVGAAYASIYINESRKPAASRLRLIHTRVYGQAVAVVTTVCVLGLAEALDMGAFSPRSQT